MQTTVAKSLWTSSFLAEPRFNRPSDSVLTLNRKLQTPELGCRLESGPAKLSGGSRKSTAMNSGFPGRALLTMKPVGITSLLVGCSLVVARSLP